MAYTSGGIIEATDYNGFVQQINQIYSDLYPGATTVPFADYGYGAASALPSVAAGNTVTAAQWTALLNRISLCGTHQGITIAPLPGFVNSGDSIVALADLISKLSNTVSSRMSVAAGQTTFIGGTTASSSTSWLASRSWTWSANFGSWDNARYFFNLGGSISIAGSYTGGSNPGSDAFWTMMLTNMGTVSLRALDSNPVYNGTGFYDLNTSYQEYYRRTPGSGGSYYNNSYISLEAKLAAAAGTSGVVDFKITLVDGDVTPNAKTGSLSFTPSRLTSSGAIPYPGTLSITNGSFGS